MCNNMKPNREYPQWAEVFLFCHGFYRIGIDGANNSLLICHVGNAKLRILGFLDDFLKVALKRNLGLRSYQKLFRNF